MVVVEKEVEAPKNEIKNCPLYIICRVQEKDLRVTQKMLAHTAGVTEVTVRNRYKALEKQLGMRPSGEF